MNKLVSIIMPAYNCADYIVESIRSVQNQTYRNWELIVADDKSTDGTVDIVRIMAEGDNRIRLLETDRNLGPAAARNRAMDVANGNYIAFLDSDDVWYPDKLQKQLNFMEVNGYSFTYTAYEKINELGENMGVVISAPKSVDYSSMLYRGDPIGNLTVIFDVDKLGKFHVPSIKRRNDFALWLKMMHNCDRAYGLNEVLAGYRVYAGSISSAKRRDLMKYHWELYRNIEELSLVKSSAAIVTLVLFKLARLTNEMAQESKNNRRVVRAEKAEKSTGDNNLKSTIENINEKTRIDFSRTAEIDLAVANGVYNKNESTGDDMRYAEK